MKKMRLTFLSISLFALTLTACSSTAQSNKIIHSSPEEAEIEQSAVTSKPRVEYAPLKTVDMAARQSVVSAYDAMRMRQWDALPGYAYSAQNDHELGNYPMYWYLRQQLTSSQGFLPTTELKKFIKDNPRTYVADRLKAEWIIAAVKQGDYRTASTLGPVHINNSQAICAYNQALAASGQHVDSTKVIRVIKGNERCAEMVGALYRSGQLSKSRLTDLFRDAVEYDNKFMAKKYAGFLFDGTDFMQYQAIIVNPMQWLATQSGTAGSPQQAELRAIAFSRLARQDRNMGITILENRGPELLSAKDLQWAYSQFALVAVLNQEVRADAWYRLAKDSRLSDYNSAWRTRAALRQSPIDWKWVEKSIDLMNPEQKKETAWIYWKAKALQQQGKSSQATELYRLLQEQHDFYGQLAQEELTGKIVIPPQAAPVTDKELAHIKQNTGLQRAVALFRLGWRAEAVPEWSYAIDGLKDRDLLAAAAWAEQEQIFDRVINTSLLTKKEINFAQRYIAPFNGRVGQQARQVGIDPSWVYGLIRQESRFVQVARSGVGASGLMQVMPGTASLVAKQIGMYDFSPSKVNEFETNAILGTNYLRIMLEKLGGNEILATAGYNAGPNRAVRWRDNLTQRMDGAIFAETIPFTETRLYVKHVLSNAVWYDMLLNGKTSSSLKKRLGMVTP